MENPIQSDQPDSAHLQRIRWLADNGHQLLKQATDSLPSNLRSQLSTWQLSMLKEQVAMQKRTRRRFPDAYKWLWTSRSLAQASDWWTAQYKAHLFPEDANPVDACCGAGVDLVALSGRCSGVVGIDADSLLTHLAMANVRAHGLTAQVIVGNVPSCIGSDVQWLHIDPDRRPSNYRTNSGDHFSPPLSDVLELAQRMQGSVIKLAPATQWDVETEQSIASAFDRHWIGSFGECRQQLLIGGALRTSRDTERKAVIVGNESSSCNEKSRHIEYSGRVSNCSVSIDPQTFVYDLDSTLHASQLAASWATQHDMSALGGQGGYYTSSQAVDSPWAQTFEVVDIIAWDDRKIRRWLRSNKIASVEIKNRLHGLDANYYQRRYASGEANAGKTITLLVTKIGERVRAIAANRVRRSGTNN